MKPTLATVEHVYRGQTFRIDAVAVKTHLDRLQAALERIADRAVADPALEAARAIGRDL